MCGKFPATGTPTVNRIWITYQEKYNSTSLKTWCWVEAQHFSLIKPQGSRSIIGAILCNWTVECIIRHGSGRCLLGNGTTLLSIAVHLGNSWFRRSRRTSVSAGWSMMSILWNNITMVTIMGGGNKPWPLMQDFPFSVWRAFLWAMVWIIMTTSAGSSTDLWTPFFALTCITLQR